MNYFIFNNNLNDYINDYNYISIKKYIKLKNSFNDNFILYNALIKKYIKNIYIEYNGCIFNYNFEQAFNILREFRNFEIIKNATIYIEIFYINELNEITDKI